MKRIPVPDARASSACVRPIALRSFLTNLPKSSGVINIRASDFVPDREYYRDSGGSVIKYSRAGIYIFSRPLLDRLFPSGNKS